MRRARLLVPTLAASLLLGACTGDDTGGPTTTSAPSTTVAVATTASTPPSDGVLTIALLIPRSTDSQLGESLRSASEMARRDIVEAGGQVVLETFNEDDAAGDVLAIIEEMQDRDVDVIVGPASSTVTIEVLDDIIEGGMAACSPTASSLMLDDFPDDGMFFRSIPSDSLQALAIAEEATGTGGSKVAFAYLDDIYGRGLFNAVRDNLNPELHEVDSEIAFSPNEDRFDRQVRRLLQEDPDVIIVTADDSTGPEFLAEIGRQLAADGSDETPWIIVNGAMRRPGRPGLIAEMPDDVRSHIIGVSPTATPPADSGLRGPYSVNAYDCVTALALASLQADSDRASAIASELSEVSSNGLKCTTYQDCAAVQGLNIDYDGPSGTFELGEETGDPTEATFDVFRYDSEGIDETFRSLSLSVP